MAIPTKEMIERLKKIYGENFLTDSVRSILNGFSGRHYSKSFLQRLTNEALLDSGKVIHEVSPTGTRIKKRTKHLTCIEKVKDNDNE